jgi:hypothetical protein
MKKEVGLWVNHRRAVLVINLNQQEEIKRVTSRMEKHVRYSGGAETHEANELHNDSTENGRNRRFNGRLNHYYNKIISYLRDATSILILGPGVAKGELQNRLEIYGLGDRIVAIKTTDKMTDDQIVAEVRQYFRDSQHDTVQIDQQRESSEKT